jgi:hypothetical protein
MPASAGSGPAGQLPAATEVTRLPDELEETGDKDHHTDRDRYGARQRTAASRPPPARRPAEMRPFENGHEE